MSNRVWKELVVTVVVAILFWLYYAVVDDEEQDTEDEAAWTIPENTLCVGTNDAGLRTLTRCE